MTKKNDSKSQGVDEITFIKVLFKVFQQYYLHKGLQKFGDRGMQAMRKELRQMHL